MKLGLKIIIPLFLLCKLSFAAPLLTHYWQCKALDSLKQQWTVDSAYQKVALNLALDTCKKESKAPISCKTNIELCDEYNLGLNLTPQWQCTALDAVAASWPSNLHLHRDDAAMAAQAYCRDKSEVPDTCYLNFVTCSNITLKRS